MTEQPYDPAPRKLHTGRLVLLIFGVLVVVGIIIGATQAGAEKTVTTPDRSPDATVSADDPLAQQWGDTAELEDMQVTVAAPVDDTKNLDEISRMFLGDSTKVIACMVSIANTGSEICSYNTLAFTLYDVDGLSYDSWGSGSQPNLGSGDVLPGKTVRGAVAFEMPTAAMPSYVNFQPTMLSDTEASWGE